MPSGFKAQGTRLPGIPQTAYAFENGFYSIDEQDRLKGVMLNSPAMPKGDGLSSSYSEKQKEQAAQANEFGEELRAAATIVGPRIPEEQRSTLKFTTWNGKDFFTLTEKDILAIYGPPSEPISPYEPNPGGDSIFDTGMPKIMSYDFQTGPSSTANINFFFRGEGTAKDAVSFISINWRDNVPVSSGKGHKVYPWPGLYPVPGK
jgi:hypothetical protein